MRVGRCCRSGATACSRTSALARRSTSKPWRCRRSHSSCAIAPWPPTMGRHRPKPPRRRTPRRSGVTPVALALLATVAFQAIPTQVPVHRRAMGSDGAAACGLAIGFDTLTSISAALDFVSMPVARHRRHPRGRCRSAGRRTRAGGACGGFARHPSRHDLRRTGNGRPGAAAGPSDPITLRVSQVELAEIAAPGHAGPVRDSLPGAASNTADPGGSGGVGPSTGRGASYIGGTGRGGHPRPHRRMHH